MDKKYGIYADLAPTPRQRLFEAVRNKAENCADWTQLCAAIYPWILHLVREYEDKPNTHLTVDSFRMEIYDFQRAMLAYPSAIPALCPRTAIR